VNWILYNLKETLNKSNEKDVNNEMVLMSCLVIVGPPGSPGLDGKRGRKGDKVSED